MTTHMAKSDMQLKGGRRSAFRPSPSFALVAIAVGASVSCLDDSPVEPPAAMAQLSISAQVRPITGDTLSFYVYAPPQTGLRGTKPIDLYRARIAVDSGARFMAASFNLEPCLVMLIDARSRSCVVHVHLELVNPANGLTDSTTLQNITVRAGGLTSIPGRVQLGNSANPVRTVEIVPAASTLAVGDTLSLAAVPRDSAGLVVALAPVAWMSSDTTIAQISQSGLLQAVTTGRALIVADVGGRIGTAQVDVVP